MKSSKKIASIIRGKFLTVASVILFAGAAAMAQDIKHETLTKEDSAAIRIQNNLTALTNMQACIKSENKGVRRSSIYMAGKYKLAEAVLPLTEQLRNESDAQTRILIALSLHKIGDAQGLAAVKQFAASDRNSEVRRMCTAIYNDYTAKKNDTTKYAKLSVK